jgi:WD40 repeat protein
MQGAMAERIPESSLGPLVRPSGSRTGRGRRSVPTERLCAPAGLLGDAEVADRRIRGHLADVGGDFDGVGQQGDGVEAAVLRGHEEPISSVAVSPDGKRLATVAGDGLCCLWNTRTWQLEKTMMFTKGCNLAAFAPGGQILHANRDALEDEIVYMIEENSGKRLNLKPSEFARRFPGALP